MTAPRIEDERGRKIGEDEYTEHWSLDGHTYIQVPKWVITQAHQAGIDEAVEIIKGMKRNQDAPKENDPHFTGCGGCGEAYPAICGCREVNQALDDTLTIINSIFKE